MVRGRQDLEGRGEACVYLRGWSVSLAYTIIICVRWQKRGEAGVSKDYHAAYESCA